MARGCAGCGGRQAHLAAKAAQAEARRADFEAWLAAGKPNVAEWRAAKADRAYNEMTIAEAEALTVTAEG